MANMRCTVKFFLDQVTCPGTLHLPERNPVYMSIFLFGRVQRSPHVYPSFPMTFTTKIKFQRLFTNAKTPEQVLEILEDETILIELRQYTKGLKGGRILAEFEESARSFLFPTPSYIPKRNLLKRDVLLTRTENFPVGKGLDPQFRFRTKTYIEEGPFIHDLVEIPINRQVPPSVSPSAKHNNGDSIHKGKVSKKKKRSKSTSPKKLRTSYVSEQVEDVRGTTDSSYYHCVCDCPSLDEEPTCLDHWLNSMDNIKSKKTKVKPFRAGKAPKHLLSKREFEDLVKNKEKNYTKKGICKYCVVPLPTCVLCTAYKTVYGPSTYLYHRFKKENRKATREKRRPRNKGKTSSPSPSPDKVSNPVYDSAKYSRRASSIVDESILNADGNLKPRSYSVSKYSDAIGYPPRSSTRASVVSPLLRDEKEVKDVPPKSRPTTPLFTNHARLAEDENILYRMNESQRIHDHVKDLMRKNNSALLYELSSSESITDEDYEDIEDDFDIEDLTSETESLAWGQRKWSSLRKLATPISSSHRDRLDDRLKEIYAELYQRTLNNS